jgi:hypothetical protein
MHDFLEADAPLVLPTVDAAVIDMVLDEVLAEVRTLVWRYRRSRSMVRLKSQVLTPGKT